MRIVESVAIVTIERMPSNLGSNRHPGSSKAS
jgi:hypothetical protein